MAKSGPQTKELQRRLLRLLRLDGRLVLCTDGAFLVWPERVRDPRPLVQALRAGHGLTCAVLRQSLLLQHEPLLLTARWLATAQRDLRALQKDPAALPHTQEAARRFRGLPHPTPVWLAGRQQRLTALAAELQESAAPMASVPAVPQPARTMELPWFTAGVALVRTLRAPADSAALQSIWERSVAASQVPTARRRLLGLIARLSRHPDPRPEDPPLAAFLDAAAQEVHSLLGPESPSSAGRRLGRAQLRRLWRLVRRVVFWPTEPATSHAGELDIAALGAIGDRRRLVAELAAPLLADLPRARDPQHRIRLAHVLCHYALLFRMESSEPSVSALDATWLEQQLDRAITELAPYELTMRQALGLLRLPDPRKDLTQLARHVAAGLPLDLLLRTCQLGYDAELRAFTGETAALRAYCEWVVRLAPLYQQSGHKLTLAASVTSRFTALREPNLALLVQCLIGSASEAAPRSVDVALQLTVLDAAVGLCGRVPQRAAALVSGLTTWPTGTGRARFPEFADWLLDDAGLDRYLHLAELAGEPAELSRTLLRDFAQAERCLRERRYLISLPAPSTDQTLRLAAINKALAEAALPSPSWTRRCLAERIADLLGRALRRQLDIALRDVLRQAFGLAPQVLTPAWRDAVRFYLLTEHNGELLGTLLRFAAAHPGRSPAQVWAANQRWLRRASPRMNGDAWLADYRTEIDLDGERYVLAIEQDPIEVLRMGIPFGTCLSLAEGCNAAAAVTNAVDANKRVLYLRDRRGVIVGRKLLAVSADCGLLGYELYLSLEARLRPLVEKTVLALCEQLAQATGIPLALSGAPERLHDGFWYDDGPQPFTSPQVVDVDVSAYCSGIGQPVPTPSTPDLRTEAAQWQSRESGAVTRALGLLRAGRQQLCDHELGAWVIERLGLLPATKLANLQHGLRPFVLRRAAGDGSECLLQIAATLQDCDAYEVRQNLRTGPAPLAVSLIAAAEQVRRRRERPNDHGFCHLTFSDLAPSLAVTPVAQLLALTDRLQTLWDWFVASETGCQPCRESAEAAVGRAARRAYCRQPDPASVIICLRSRRTSRLAQRTAVHLAAAFPLLETEALPSALGRFIPPPRVGAPAALRALQALGQRNPELAREPDFLAALLRQSPRPLRIELPTPARLPFEELADLLLDPSARQLVQTRVGHLVSGPEDLGTYRPGPWELYYHRRHATPLRQRVARAAQALPGETPLPQPLLSLLIDLGDVQTLTALAERFPGGHRGRNLKEALAEATTVAWQVELDSQPLDALLRTLGPEQRKNPLRSPTRPDPRDLSGRLDPELWRRVLLTIDRTLTTQAPVDPEYCWALRALTLAPLSHAAAGELVQTLMQARHGVLDAAELAFVAWFLETKTSWEFPEVTPEFAVELWQHPELRNPMAAALTHSTEWPARYHRMAQAAQSTGRVLDGLLDQWLPLLVDRDVDTAVAAISTRAELHLFLDVALTCMQPPQWLAIYRALGGYAEAACFLDRLQSARVNANALQQLQRLVEATSWHYPDEQARGGWLTARLVLLCAKPSG